MNDIIVMDIIKQALYMVLKLSAPMLVGSLVVGLVISILQTVTSIQEQTLTFVPKLIAVLLIIMIFGTWMINSVKDFMIELFSNFGYYINSL